MNAVIDLLFSSVNIWAGFAADRRVHIRIGRVGACKMHAILTTLRLQRTDVERNLTATGSVHINAGRSVLNISVSGKVGLSMIVTNVLVCHYTELGAFPKYIIRINRLIVCCCRQIGMVCNDGSAMFIIICDVYVFFVAGVILDGVIFVTNLHRVAFRQGNAVLTQGQRECLVAGNRVAGITNGRPVLLDKGIVTRLILYLIGNDCPTVRIGSRWTGASRVRIGALRGRTGDIIHQEGVGASSLMFRAH